MAVKRILVTGANGQLGNSLQVVSESLEGTEFLFLGRSDLDITQPHQIAEWFAKFRPDYCINCAAYTQVDQAEKSPEEAYHINAEGVENLAKACSEYGTTLIHISTDYVFDGKKTEGYTPGDLPNPINVYGKTKLEGEQRIQRELSTFFIIRTSWLYSKKYGPNFYLTILDRAKRENPLQSQILRPDALRMLKIWHYIS